MCYLKRITFYCTFFALSGILFFIFFFFNFYLSYSSLPLSNMMLMMTVDNADDNISFLLLCPIFFVVVDNQETQCATLNCSFNCKLTPQGPKCYCAPGQVPVNVTQCMDFDECSIEGMCDQLCRNTPGSYECSCVSGYVKQKNRCYAINGKYFIYFLLLLRFFFFYKLFPFIPFSFFFFFLLCHFSPANYSVCNMIFLFFFSIKL